MDGPREVYAPRKISALGVWDAGPLRLKIYGLEAEGQSVTDAMSATARHVFETEVVARADAMGDSNNLGFVIIHPGTMGVSISSHWWVQGCVLCQHFFRQLYDAEQPMKTEGRPAIGCVWELAIVEAEQRFWRKKMMGKRPDAEGYLAARPETLTV